ncbi:MULTISPECIES: Na(+)-translocating NADH-quinone reductase subunit F [unclassified Leeuwenhoekiella]|uniref:Na(+)-translocating NADH-quinone reductase subunit F n=1 Tax=unclassified Leeuwenhoekiella TaxID=2615029 RepID=UPI000C3A86BD|nr:MULTISPECIES: Na(+)-translocating NADH-quinone reductase subunit F [unclassified Leeuwenhoekiella]MAW95693.1 Na(+)-translocating NADH-quinone reductase subunit F [Leeuwenhoekiella sp.]MBA80757.1 Na(+)-translocating NADH-quinone reductase subunit F [Leeuwenhoekiella sp.]|tara:strand:+ start:16449 stop:16913 length:465 start_codon:yes stop_codon:yes gene_type:complete
MKNSRFENAIQKLYRAFHANTLDPECCKSCAVGNILDNTDSWKHLTEGHGSLRLSYVGQINEAFNKRFQGYSPGELLQIEAAFLRGCGYQLPLKRNSFRPEDRTSKHILFDGLCEAITVLCKLDTIPNVMDYQDLLKSKNFVSNSSKKVSAFVS